MIVSNFSRRVWDSKTHPQEAAEACLCAAKFSAKGRGDMWKWANKAREIIREAYPRFLGEFEAVIGCSPNLPPGVWEASNRFTQFLTSAEKA